MGHGFIQLAGHQGLRHGLLSTLPEEQCHLLALHQHRPQHQLVEGELESTDLGVIHVNLHLFLFLLFCLFLAFLPGFIILNEKKKKRLNILLHVRCIVT